MTSSSSDSHLSLPMSLLGDPQVCGVLVADSCSMVTTSSFLATLALAAESLRAQDSKDMYVVLELH